jgi:hypothetical protein
MSIEFESRCEGTGRTPAFSRLLVGRAECLRVLLPSVREPAGFVKVPPPPPLLLLSQPPLLFLFLFNTVVVDIKRLERRGSFDRWPWRRHLHAFLQLLQCEGAYCVFVCVCVCVCVCARARARVCVCVCKGLSMQHSKADVSGGHTRTRVSLSDPKTQKASQ